MKGALNETKGFTAIIIKKKQKYKDKTESTKQKTAANFTYFYLGNF